MANVTEELVGEGWLVAEAVAEDAEGPWGVAEALGRLGRGEFFDEEGAEGFVLAVAGLLWGKEEPSLWR
jgi:hypothetical protein